MVVPLELGQAVEVRYGRLVASSPHRPQTDRRSAAQAILEGQATVAQIPVLMPEQNPDTFPLGWFWQQRAVMARQQEQMKEFSKAPLWLREGLVFPYLGGADFIVGFKHKYFGRSVPSAMPRR